MAKVFIRSRKDVEESIKVIRKFREAKIVKQSWDYKWSSAKYHITSTANNYLIKDSLLREIITDWQDFLSESSNTDEVKLFQLHERTGRPLGNNTFIEKLESLLKTPLKKKMAGRPRKNK